MPPHLSLSLLLLFSMLLFPTFFKNNPGLGCRALDTSPPLTEGTSTLSVLLLALSSPDPSHTQPQQLLLPQAEPSTHGILQGRPANPTVGG